MRTLCGWLSCSFLLGPAVSIPAAEIPRSDRGVDAAYRGTPLKEALSDLGARWGLKLYSSRYLEAQRVSIFGQHVRAEVVCDGLADLLSVPESAARVSWAQDADAWRLNENSHLRDLAKSLKDADLRIFREFLAGELRWFEKEGHAEAASSRRALVPAALLELGDNAVRSLLAGSPISVRASETSPPVRGRLIALFRETNPQLADATDTAVAEHSVVMILARSPNDIRGTELIISFVEPSGFRWARLGGFSRPPGWRFPTAAIRTFTLPRPDPADSSRPITVNLSPVEPGGQGIRQDLDDVLKLLAEAFKTPIVADGYLRPKVAFPANLIAQDYPRDQLLQVVATTWGCSVRFSKHGAVLFRARDWWLDDAADVPEADLRWVRETFGAGRMVTFDGLLRLSTFSTPQLHRLRDADLIPAAQGLVVPFFFDEPGGRAVLRFVAGLPDAERRRVLSAPGLRLKDAPAELVRLHLSVAAATHAGVADPAAQLELVVRMLPSPSGRGFRIELFDDSGRPRAARWTQDVGL